MKKSFVLPFVFTVILFIIFHSNAHTQTWTTQEGQITFFSEAPLENIDATSKKLVSVLNTRNRQVASRVAINTFQFRNGLMQEHFNDNYMESDKYPLANLRAQIVEDIDFTKNGKHKVTLEGTMEMRDIEKEMTIPGTIEIKDGKILATSEFIVKLEDHDIKVPRMLTRNIAEEILVTVKIEYKPHNQ
ncbi:MAG: YceI family protein [Chitinophagaceae bacterium]|nr:MAG: YceI family protein [Chitinophagaceae bacterium]